MEVLTIYSATLVSLFVQFVTWSLFIQSGNVHILCNHTDQNLFKCSCCIVQLHPTKICWELVLRPNSRTTKILLKATSSVLLQQPEKQVEQKHWIQPSVPEVKEGWDLHLPWPLMHYQQTDTLSGSRTPMTDPDIESWLPEYRLRAGLRGRWADRSHTGEYVLCCDLDWATGSRRRPEREPTPPRPILLLSGATWSMSWRDGRSKVLQRGRAGRLRLRAPCGPSR